MDVIAQYSLRRQNQQILQLLGQALPDNDAIQSGVGTLVHKRSAWKQKILHRWESRNIPGYTEFDVRTMCLQAERNYQLNYNRGDNLHQNMKPLPHARDWIVKTRKCWRGYDPSSASYFPQPIEYGDTVDFTIARNSVIQEQHSGAVDIIKSMLNLIDLGVNMGLNETGFEALFIDFVRTFLPNSLSVISRYTGSCFDVVDQIASLVDGNYEIEKVRKTIRGIKRPAHEHINFVATKIKSLYVAIYNLVSPDMSLEKLQSRTEAHTLDCLKLLIKETTAQNLEKLNKIKISDNEQFALSEVIDFIGDLETTNMSCTWDTELTLPRQAATLDYSSMELSAETDLAINFNQIQNRGRSPGRAYPENRGYSTGSGYNRFSPANSRGGSRDRGRSRDREHGNRGRQSSKDRGRQYSNERGRQSSNSRSYGTDTRGRFESNPRGRSNSRDKSPRNSSTVRNSSKSPRRPSGCVRCGDQSHLGDSCRRYPDYCRSQCSHCGLHHETRYCRSAKGSKYKSPSRKSWAPGSERAASGQRSQGFDGRSDPEKKSYSRDHNVSTKGIHSIVTSSDMARNVESFQGIDQHKGKLVEQPNLFQPQKN